MAFFRGPNMLTDDLLLYLDAANTNSYSGSSTSWVDLSGRNNHAFLMNGASFNSMNQGSIYFNGNGYVRIPRTTIYDDFFLEFRPFSMSFWLYNLSTNLNWNRIISTKINYNDGDGWDIGLFTGSSNHLYVAMGSQIPYGDINCVNWIGTGWHNLVINYNSSDEGWVLLEVWCDGIYRGTTTNINRFSPNGNPILIGKISSESTTQWNGYMSVIQIYNKWLTQSEILQNFNSLRKRYNI